MSSFGEDKFMSNSNNSSMITFSDEQFKMPNNKFVEELEVLEKNSCLANNLSDTSLARRSLYRQFDPLIEVKTPSHQVMNSRYLANDDKFNTSSMTKLSNDVYNNDSYMAADNDFINNTNESTALMNFNSPSIVTNHSLLIDENNENNGKSNFDMKNALRTQELLFQEKLIEKERTIYHLEEKLKQTNNSTEKYQYLFNIIHNFNQEIVDIVSEVFENIFIEKTELIDRCNQMTKDRTQALEDVNSVEKSFYEVHHRYDKVRSALEESKLREVQLKEQYLEVLDKLNEREQMYGMLKSKAEEKLENANSIIESARRECETELIAVKAQLKRAEMKINGLQSQLDQKTHENDELTKMIDDLIEKVEK